jgi:hypothetical protein
MKTCTVCKNSFDLEMFCKNRRSADGRHYVCRSCHNQDKSEYRLKKKDFIREQGKKYYDTRFSSKEGLIRRVWDLMKQRCNNPDNPSYKNYGGRGIRIEWNSFEEFYNDMSGGYEPKRLQLDRINNDGNYAKDNCRWATRSQQINNTRRCRFFYFNGERMTLAQICKITGVSRDAINYRTKVLGLNIEEAIKEKVYG